MLTQKPKLIAIILKKIFAFIGIDYLVFRQKIVLFQQQTQRIIRKLFEAINLDFFSKPSILNMHGKILKYLPYSDGFFIEVGANNGFNQSNTYYLEKFRSWKGLLIEGIPELYQECLLERPQSKVINCALVSEDFTEPYVTMTYSGLTSLVNGAFQNHEQEQIHLQKGAMAQGYLSCYQIEVPARTLTSILDEYGVKEIDFFSLDVEGFELSVLQGLDFNKYRPKYLLIETSFKKDVDDYLKDYYIEIEQLTVHDYLYQRKVESKIIS
jgi:FkbM family methyltransferase